MRDAEGRFLKGAHWRKHAPHWDADWLRREYDENGRSAEEIALEAGTTGAAILYWLKKHNIKRRSTSEARRIKHWGSPGATNPMFGRTGEANPRYVDGRSPERQRIYAQSKGKAFLRAVLDRDKHCCRRCGAAAQSDKFLHVHHIVPWNECADLRLDPENAVTLCSPCHSWVHSRANENRDFLK